MNTSIILKSFVAVFLMVSVTGMAFAQQQNKQEKKHVKRTEILHKHKKIEHAPRLPDLTEEQREQIKEIMIDTRQEVLPLQNQLREKRARLKTLRTAESPDLNEMNSAIEEIAGLRAEIMKTRVTSEQEIRELLNEEQRIIFDSRKQAIKKRMIDRHVKKRTETKYRY